MTLRKRLAALRAALAAHRGLLFELAGALIVAAALLLLGLRGWERAGLAQQAARDAREALQATSGWEQRLRAADDPERSSWAASRQVLDELAMDPNERLDLLDLVAQRAGQVGVPDAQVIFTSVAAPVERAVTGWSVVSADYGLQVSFLSDYWSAVAFAGSLPPMLELLQLQLIRLEGMVQTDLRLAVYQAASRPAMSAEDPVAWKAADWTRLSAYLAPVAPARTGATEALAMIGEGRDPFSRPIAARPVAPEPVDAPIATEPEHVWALSAIMITDRRRIAVIDGRVVKQGDTLAEGAIVSAIEPTHVTIRERSGRTRELRVSRSNQP